MHTHRLSALIVSVLVSACGDPAASPAPESAAFASLPGIPIGGSGGWIEPPDSTADDSVGEVSPPEAAGGDPALLDVVSAGGAGGAGGAPAATEADPCWQLPSLCYCGLPIMAPAGNAGISFSDGADYIIVDSCTPPEEPNPALEWCCDTWSGACRCWQRQRGECQYWREQGFWVSGCSAA